jgi:hypothetical protein
MQNRYIGDYRSACWNARIRMVIRDYSPPSPPWLFQARTLGAATCQWLSVSCAATARSTSRAATSTALHKRLVPRPCIIDRVQHLRDRCCHLSPDWRGGAMRCAVHFRRIRLWLGDRCDATLRSGVAVEAGDAHRSDVRRDVDDLSSTRGDDCRYPEPAAKESANRSRRIARHSSIAASTTVLSAGSGSRRNCRLSLPHAGRPRGRLQRCRGAVSGASGEGSGEKRWRRAVRRHERRQPRNPSMSSGGDRAGRIDFGRSGGNPRSIIRCHRRLRDLIQYHVAFGNKSAFVVPLSNLTLRVP